MTKRKHPENKFERRVLSDKDKRKAKAEEAKAQAHQIRERIKEQETAYELRSVALSAETDARSSSLSVDHRIMDRTGTTVSA